MNHVTTPRTSRRVALQSLGLGAMALPLLSRLLCTAAYAQGINGGVAPNQGAVTHIPEASARVFPMAEWEQHEQGSEAADSRNQIAQGTEAIAKASPTASRYEARAFEFPTGSLRILSWKKGAPVMHQITFETEMMVLRGSVTVTPMFGHHSQSYTLHAGDAAFLPAGVLRSAKPTEDTVILQAFVGSANAKAKASVVRAKEVTAKPLKVSSGTYTVRRYGFDGNSFRVVNMPKGVTTDQTEQAPYDRLVYVVRGHMRRTEGSNTYDAHAGDAFRENKDKPGYWEVMESAEIVVTDAPFKPGNEVAGLARTSSDLNIQAMILDDNSRSTSSFVSIPMHTASDTESFSEKQAGLYWRIGYRPQINEFSRTDREFKTPGGPYEMHVGGDPHFVGLMAGHLESTHQDGSVWRLAPGDFNYVCPGCLHHSNFRSEIPGIMFNLFLPGTAADTQTPVFK